MFEVIASEDAAEQERLAGNRAVIAVQTRAKSAFGAFVSKAGNETERNARIQLVSEDLDKIVNEVAAEYDYDGTDRLHAAATVALGGGHASDCTCGFCENKGSFGKDDDGEEREKEERAEAVEDWAKRDKESAVKTACGCGSCGPDGCDCADCPKKKEGAIVTSHNLGEFPWEHVARVVESDGFSFCKCDCEGCNGGNHCESQECIESKHSGNPGNPASNGSSDKESKTAADVETGDTYAQERVDLPSSKDGLGDTGAVPTDKSKSGDNLGWDLKPIDVPSERNPVEKQQIHETPEYSADLPGVSDTGKRIDAESPLQPEHNVADNTDTWTGTERQADPVTSAVLAKWSVLT